MNKCNQECSPKEGRGRCNWKDRGNVMTEARCNASGIEDGRRVISQEMQLKKLEKAGKEFLS